MRRMDSHNVSATPNLLGAAQGSTMRFRSHMPRTCNVPWRENMEFSSSDLADGDRASAVAIADWAHRPFLSTKL